MPGTRLLEFARRWFPPSTVASVFEPLVADWQREWSDASRTHRRWINAKGAVAFAATAARLAPRVALTPSSLRASPLMLAGGFWLVTSALLTMPYVQENMPLNHWWLMLPSSMTVMLPFAMMLAIDGMRRGGGEPTPAQRRGTFVLVVVAVCGVAIGQGWITPAANQTYRNETMSRINGRPSIAWKGVRERTTLDLIAGEGSTIPTPARTRELASRATLALLPAVLAWLRWRSLDRARNRSWPVVKSCLLASAAFAAFFTVLPISIALERTLLAPGLGPLLALGLFAITTRTGIWLRQHAA